MEDPPDQAAHSHQEAEAGSDQQEEKPIVLTSGQSHGELAEPNVENSATPLFELDGHADDNNRARAPGSDQQEEKPIVLLTSGRSHGELAEPNVENSATPLCELDCHADDNNRAGPTRKEDEFAAGDDQLTDEESLASKKECDANPDQVDGPIEYLQEDLNDANRDDQKESRIRNPVEEEAPQVPRKSSTKNQADDLRTKVESIGPTTQETADLGVTETPGVRRYLLGMGVVLVLVAMVVQQVLRPDPQPPSTTPPIEIFLKQLERVQSRFPGQRPELWSRSRIHLKRHLLTQRPSEPVSLILTAGAAGHRTLRCLAGDLASAFSSALNASVLHIDGASKSGEDSDQVKLDIDGQLQGAFDGGKPVAVIHRFEQLPPGSTLIFYRYCDHENAAYKKTFLIFTVLLEGEEIPAGTSLSAVEEMVDDHLQRKFLSHGRPLAFDSMDRDKYGGLWSRISHLILPVAAEAWTENEGCS